MRARFVAAALVVSSLYTLAGAQSPEVRPLLPQNLLWVALPNYPAVQVAWVFGADQTPGKYMIRVKVAAGGKIPPHTHPDERNTTVLSGTIYVGFGEEFDEAKVVSIPTGGVYVAPANVPHYLWAKDSEAIYQESGIGPTATVLLKR